MTRFKINKLKDGEAYDVRNLTFEEIKEVVLKLISLGHNVPNSWSTWKGWYNDNILQVIWCGDSTGKSLFPRRISDGEVNKLLKLEYSSWKERLSRK